MIEPLAAGPEGRRTAYSRLRQLIIDGSLAPGALLSEPELAEQLGVSRTPIREALARLTAEGLAVKTASNRTSVAPVSAETVGHVYDIRSRLEGLIARDAARNVTDEDRRALRRQIDLMDRLRGDDEEVLRIGVEFHNRLRSMSGNEMAANLLHMLRAHVDRVRAATTRTPGRATQAVDEHRAVCEAVLSGDPELAERVMREHIDHARAVAVTMGGAAPAE